MESQKRHLFLKEFRYPAYEFEGGVRGRLTSVSKYGDEVRLEFENGQKVSLATHIAGADIICTGDIVWTSPDSSQLVILAPHRAGEPPKMRFGIDESRKWDEFLSAIRVFFKANDFIEVRTPTLVPSP